MLNFGLAMLAFIGAHTVPRLTGFRDWGIDRFSRRNYMIGYSLVSVGLLVWLIMAALNAPYVGLWTTTPLLVGIAMVLLFVASIVLVAGVGRKNSLSASFRGGETNEDNPGILAFARHPITGSTLLWALAHLLVNGDVVGVVLFGGLVVFSIFGNLAFLKRAKERLSEEELERKLNVASGSITDRFSRAFSTRFLIEIAAGVVVFLVLLFGHEHVFGVTPLAYF